MKYLTLTLLFSLSLSLPTFAHDGGHGPKVIKSGKYGGVLTKVSEGDDRSSAQKTKPLYAAELVKDDAGKVSVYLYSKDMKPTSLAGFSNPEGIIESGRGKRAKKQSFLMNKDGMSFTGQLPKKRKRPFNVIVKIKKESKSLFMAFDNLD